MSLLKTLQEKIKIFWHLQNFLFWYVSFFGLIASIDYKKNDKPIEKIHDNFLKMKMINFASACMIKKNFAVLVSPKKNIYCCDSILESFSKVLVQKLNTRNYETVLRNSSYCYFAPFFNLMDGNKIRDIPNEPCDINYQKKRLDILKKIKV